MKVQKRRSQLEETLTINKRAKPRTKIIKKQKMI